MTKNVAVLAISLLLAILIVVFVPGQFSSQANKTFETEAQEKSIIDQILPVSLQVLKRFKNYIKITNLLVLYQVRML